MHPQPEQESIFRIVFAGFGGIFRQSLRTTTKKEKKVNFFGKKVHPRQNSGYAYAPRHIKAKRGKLVEGTRGKRGKRA